MSIRSRIRQLYYMRMREYIRRSRVRRMIWIYLESLQDRSEKASIAVGKWIDFTHFYIPRVFFGGVCPCKDCGMETYRAEQYMVLDHTWEEANQTDRTGWRGTGYLCIGCIESRLGRILVEADFKAVPMNTDTCHYRNSERLLSRKGF